MRLVSSKRNFFYKSCVLSIEKKLRTNAEGIMDPQGSINENALCAFCILPLQTRKIPKYPALSLTPLISHLCSPFTVCTMPPSLLSALLCPLRKSLYSLSFFFVFLFFFRFVFLFFFLSFFLSCSSSP